MKVPPWKQGIPKQHYLRLIEEHFPNASYKTSRIIRHGYDNIVVILDDALVFRFPMEVARSAFKTELRLLKELEPRITTPIPAYIYRTKDDSFGGYKKLSGDFMMPNTFRKLSREKKKAFAKELGTFLTELHAVPLSVARKAGMNQDVDAYWWSHATCRKNLTLMKKFLSPKLTKAEAKWIERKYDAYLSLSFDFKTVILHADLVGDHILFDRKLQKISGIIDFSDAEIGDPAIDFRRLWEFEESFPGAVLSHYGHPIDADFTKRSQFPRTVMCVPHLLDAVLGKNVYFSFEENRKKLRELMGKWA